MALSATIHRLELQVSDLNRHYYATHKLTVAQHPSETALRMLVRILVFALNASEYLEFTKGLSTDEVPDLWEKTLTGEVAHWIEVGQPTARRLKKACNQSGRVSVYTFSGHSADIWWQQNRAALEALPRLRVINLPARAVSSLAALLARSMSLQCTVQEEMVWIGDNQNHVEINPEVWQDTPL